MRCTCKLNIGWTSLKCPGHGVEDDFVEILRSDRSSPKINLQDDIDQAKKGAKK